LSDFPDDGVDIYPENLHATNVFISMTTQWRVGVGGPIGLDYAAIPAVMRLCAVPVPERADTFECIRTMESEALLVMRESRG